MSDWSCRTQDVSGWGQASTKHSSKASDPLAAPTSWAATRIFGRTCASAGQTERERERVRKQEQETPIQMHCDSCFSIDFSSSFAHPWSLASCSRLSISLYSSRALRLSFFSRTPSFDYSMTQYLLMFPAPRPQQRQALLLLKQMEICHKEGSSSFSFTQGGPTSDSQRNLQLTWMEMRLLTEGGTEFEMMQR